MNGIKELNIFKKEQSFLPLMEAILHLRLQMTLYNPDLASVECGELNSLMKESCFRGNALEFPIQCIHEQLQKEEEYRLETQRIHSVVLLRICFFLILNFSVRIFLSFNFNSFSTAADRICVVCGVFSVLSYLWIAKRYYPKSWFYEGAFAEKGLLWMRALFLGELTGNSPVYESWKRLEEKERVFGMSLLAAKRALLGIWRTQEDMEYRKRLRLFEDYIPAMEFLCLGLGSFLILVNPIMGQIGF